MQIYLPNQVLSQQINCDTYKASWVDGDIRQTSNTHLNYIIVQHGLIKSVTKANFKTNRSTKSMYAIVKVYPKYKLQLIGELIPKWHQIVSSSLYSLSIDLAGPRASLAEKGKVESSLAILTLFDACLYDKCWNNTNLL